MKGRGGGGGTSGRAVPGGSSRCAVPGGTPRREIPSGSSRCDVPGGTPGREGPGRTPGSPEPRSGITGARWCWRYSRGPSSVQLLVRPAEWGVGRSPVGESLSPGLVAFRPKSEALGPVPATFRPKSEALGAWSAAVQPLVGGASTHGRPRLDRASTAARIPLPVAHPRDRHVFWTLDGVLTEETLGPPSRRGAAWPRLQST